MPGIAGFGAAAAAAQSGIAAFADLATLRDALEARVLQACPSATIFGRSAPRLPNTSCIAMPGVPAETQLMGFDLAGLAVSSGSACSSGKVAASHVLKAMGAAEQQMGSAIRASLGWDTREPEIAAFVAAWDSLYRRAGASAAA